MRFALCQLNPLVGDFKGNIEKILSTVKKHKADVYIFPELSLPGYPPQDLVFREDFLSENKKALRSLQKLVKDKLVIVGFVDSDESGRYNALAALHKGKVIGVYRKIKLPNYEVFDEKRWFDPGDEIPILDFKGIKLGLSICEDSASPDVMMLQAEAGADVLINCSASPYRQGRIGEYELEASDRFADTGKPLLFVNQVGGQDGMIYFGHSLLYYDGVIATAKDFEEDVVVVNLQ